MQTDLPSVPGLVKPNRHDSAVKGGKPKKAPVRRNPEKRRQQNIQAQKKYREKLKQRINNLETIAAAVVDDSVGQIVTSSASSGEPALTKKTNSPESISVRYPNSVSWMSQCLGYDVDYSDLDLSTSISSTQSLNVTPEGVSDYIDPITPVAKHNAISVTSWVEQVDCGCLQPHVHITSLSGSRKYQELHVANFDQTPCATDLHANAFRVERVCLVQAIMANVLHVGVTQDMFCDTKAVSPFFRPCGSMVTGAEKDAVVASVQNIYQSLKPDLRPIREQITIAHNTVLDVLPFPTLRKNLIENGSTIDTDELYYDLINGLVCWGGPGAGSKNHEWPSNHTATAGAAWDCRSWEAKTWFLQKYWELLGGEDGELVRQSEWWRHMRGDTTDLWSGCAIHEATKIPLMI